MVEVLIKALGGLTTPLSWTEHCLVGYKKEFLNSQLKVVVDTVIRGHSLFLPPFGCENKMS